MDTLIRRPAHVVSLNPQASPGTRHHCCHFAEDGSGLVLLTHLKGTVWEEVSNGAMLWPHLLLSGAGADRPRCLLPGHGLRGRAMPSQVPLQSPAPDSGSARLTLPGAVSGG